MIYLNIGDYFKVGDRFISDTPGYSNIGDFFNTILIPNIFTLAGVILLFLLIGGGIAIIQSGGNPDKQQQGSKAITAAIAGFALIFISYWIIQIIEEVTGAKIFQFTGP